MKDWNVTRLEINRKVRKVLVRHGIDLGLVTVRTYPRRVVLRGRLTRLTGSGQPLNASAVDYVIHELRRVDGVPHVHCELSNWKYSRDTKNWERAVSIDEVATA